MKSRSIKSTVCFFFFVFPGVWSCLSHAHVECVETRSGRCGPYSVWIVPRKDGGGVFSVAHAASDRARRFRGLANRTYVSLPISLDQTLGQTSDLSRAVPVSCFSFEESYHIFKFHMIEIITIRSCCEPGRVTSPRCSSVVATSSNDGLRLTAVEAALTGSSREVKGHRCSQVSPCVL